MRVKGAEWNAFYSDDTFWKEGVWYDALSVVVDDEELEDHYPVDPLITVEFSDGVVYFDEDQKKSMSFESYFKKWRKQSQVKTVCVEIPKDSFEQICEMLKVQGCKIH